MISSVTRKKNGALCFGYFLHVHRILVNPYLIMYFTSSHRNASKLQLEFKNITFISLVFVLKTEPCSRSRTTQGCHATVSSFWLRLASKACLNSNVRHDKWHAFAIKDQPPLLEYDTFLCLCSSGSFCTENRLHVMIIPCHTHLLQTRSNAGTLHFDEIYIKSLLLTHSHKSPGWSR